MRSSEATLENSVGNRSNRLAIASSLTCNLRETAVHQRHRHCTLADRRRAALDRAAPDVAGGEQAGEIGPQGKRLPGQGPSTLERLETRLMRYWDIDFRRSGPRTSKVTRRA